MLLELLLPLVRSPDYLSPCWRLSPFVFCFTSFTTPPASDRWPFAFSFPSLLGRVFFFSFLPLRCLRGWAAA